MLIFDTPSSFRTVRRFDGVSPFLAPREPHVCPVAVFSRQIVYVAIPSKSPRQGPTWRATRRYAEKSLWCDVSQE